MFGLGGLCRRGFGVPALLVFLLEAHVLLALAFDALRLGVEDLLVRRFELDRFGELALALLLLAGASLDT